MRQRSGLFAMMRQMEADTARMHQAALPVVDDQAGVRLREIAGEHRRHVEAIEGLLGACEAPDAETSRDVRDSLERHVDTVRSARDRSEALERLVEAERTLAAEYAVAEEARLQGDEPGTIRSLHDDERRFVAQLEAMLGATGGGGAGVSPRR